MRKSLLFIVLGIPVLIAVILKFFGENQYQIPIYYSHGVESQECNINIDSQYYVNGFIPKNSGQMTWKDKISICFFYSDSNKYSYRNIHELERVFSTNREPELLFFFALGDMELADDFSDIDYVKYTREDLNRIARCRLLITENEDFKGQSVYESIVLIDYEGRIRGYYDTSEIEEYDRLSAEVDILKREMFEK